MELRTQGLKNLLKNYEGKTILIVCTNSYKYKAHNLKVFDAHITFIDKYGSSVLLLIEQIASVQEVMNNGI